ncbi:RIO1 family regulatory kinase/ATPase [Deinococcus sp.]|uniref:RIO1 family regulatory kinase/ATPase domain-containing protein n=1 Tax=Deinococcus sp. TaxID=47478 RepID=UPI0025B8F99A|nr:RIO1 family regulatory kinase/ATPase [Deinococcus sp.]
MSRDRSDDSPGEQRLRRKKTKPAGRRRLETLVGANPEDISDPVVRHLSEQGYVDEVLAELKSGKEATAYIANGPSGLMLLKVYRDLEARSFKNDGLYREGEVIMDDRARRSMKNRSAKGLSLLQFDWVMREYAGLWKLWNAGLNVPEPLVGPDPTIYAETVPAVLMRLIGTEDEPAPRLSEARLSPEEAQSAWDQALAGMADMLRLGYVHGDYSTYNLLWWENTVIIIDFPQLTTRQNPNFSDLLRRDAESLSTSFRKQGIQVPGEDTLREVQRRALGPAPTPRVTLP